MQIRCAAGEEKTALRARFQTFTAANPGIAAVYLFGSAATGKMTPASDLDIALMCTGQMDGFEKISMETASPTYCITFPDLRLPPTMTNNSFSIFV